MMDAHRLVESMIEAFMGKDIERVLDFFADEATMIDPHYPQKEMVGKPAIAAGLRWAFQFLEQPGFELLNLIGRENLVAIEVRAHHRFKGGKSIRFNEVFVAELHDGKITRLQAYPDYGPGGIQNVMLRLQRFWLRIHKKKTYSDK
ncbi:MAG: nuclear transport factor 2 family protein [Calditrichaeota bacterium]|nr:MAG: nuclear transport factor 2 family protein [Calditrichota bacterium]